VTSSAESADPVTSSRIRASKWNELGAVGTGKVLLTPEDAADALSIGRTRVYELMRSGALGSVTIGSSRRVPVAALERFVAHLEGSDQGGIPATADRPTVTRTHQTGRRRSRKATLRQVEAFPFDDQAGLAPTTED
jgi:excisionase family DNA binding protein